MFRPWLTSQPIGSMAKVTMSPAAAPTNDAPSPISAAPAEASSPGLSASAAC
jgi:hypothetical protein